MSSATVWAVAIRSPLAQSSKQATTNGTNLGVEPNMLLLSLTPKLWIPLAAPRTQSQYRYYGGSTQGIDNQLLITGITVTDGTRRVPHTDERTRAFDD